MPVVFSVQPQSQSGFYIWNAKIVYYLNLNIVFQFCMQQSQGLVTVIFTRNEPNYLYTKELGLFCAVIVTHICDNNVQAPILTSSFQTSSHCWRFHWSVCYKLSRLSFPIKSGSCSIAGRWLKIMKNSNLTIITINLIEMVDLKMMW